MFFGKFLSLVFLLVGSLSAQAGEITGSRQISLEGPGGEVLTIGTIELVAAATGTDFKLEMDDTKFSDQFLSMRPFKCIDGDTMVCRLEYPYTKGNTYRPEAPYDLEYEFLFIVRSPTEYGIDPYNGRYFRISREGDELVGKVYAVDLNLLAVPPEDGVLYPLTEDLLDELEPESERFSILRIH